MNVRLQNVTVIYCIYTLFSVDPTEKKNEVSLSFGKKGGISLLPYVDLLSEVKSLNDVYQYRLTSFRHIGETYF